MATCIVSVNLFIIFPTLNFSDVGEIRWGDVKRELIKVVRRSSDICFNGKNIWHARRRRSSAKVEVSSSDITREIWVLDFEADIGLHVQIHGINRSQVGRRKKWGGIFMWEERDFLKTWSARRVSREYR